MVKFKKTLTGKELVIYDCPHCDASLNSPTEEIGINDSCPECGEEFVVPGSDEREWDLPVENNNAKKSTKGVFSLISSFISFVWSIIMELAYIFAGLWGMCGIVLICYVVFQGVKDKVEKRTISTKTEISQSVNSTQGKSDEDIVLEKFEKILAAFNNDEKLVPKNHKDVDRFNTPIERNMKNVFKSLNKGDSLIIPYNGYIKVVCDYFQKEDGIGVTHYISTATYNLQFDKSTKQWVFRSEDYQSYDVRDGPRRLTIDQDDILFDKLTPDTRDRITKCLNAQNK